MPAIRVARWATGLLSRHAVRDVLTAPGHGQGPRPVGLSRR
ncbi:hypothetical protein [Nonomuraea longicatena]